MKLKMRKEENVSIIKDIKNSILLPTMNFSIYIEKPIISNSPCYITYDTCIKAFELIYVNHGENYIIRFLEILYEKLITAIENRGYHKLVNIDEVQPLSFNNEEGLFQLLYMLLDNIKQSDVEMIESSIDQQGVVCSTAIHFLKEYFRTEFKRLFKTDGYQLYVSKALDLAYKVKYNENWNVLYITRCFKTIVSGLNTNSKGFKEFDIVTYKPNTDISNTYVKDVIHLDKDICCLINDMIDINNQDVHVFKYLSSIYYDFNMEEALEKLTDAEISAGKVIIYTMKEYMSEHMLENMLHLVDRNDESAINTCKFILNIMLK